MNKIIVIGAGIAGLAAANHLRQSGLEVTILEARDRFGGRIHVDYSWGFPISKGATWIHGAANNPMLDLAKRYACQIFSYDREKSYTFSASGELLAKAEVEAFDEAFEKALAKAKEYAMNASQDCSLAEALQPFWNTDNFNPAWQALFAKRLKFFENYIGDNYERLSARYWDLGGSLAKENFILSDGYSAILQGLAKDCDIKLNTCVKMIDYQQKEIKVITNNGDYIANKLIITLPLGVLKTKQVTFIPELPKTKQEAIHIIGMGLFDVIGLKFSNIFWPNQSSSMYIFDNEAITCNVFFNLQPVKDQPILFGYVGGATARALETLTDQQVLDKVMRTLANAFGSDLAPPERYFITRWWADPFSLGSYSYVAVGANAQHFVSLSNPVENKLYFAGEATNAHLYDATVHGAYLSGIREAERILTENTLSLR